jgi:hypothetical protein
VFVPATGRVGLATVARDGRGRSEHGRRRAEPRRFHLADGFPLRVFGIATAAIGTFLIESSSVRGPVAVIGLILVALGLAAFDAIDRGEVGARHAGLVAAVVGGGLGSWSLAIVALLVLLELPVDSHLWAILGSGAIGLLAGLVVVRRGVPWVAARGRWKHGPGARATGPDRARGAPRRTAA